MSNIRYYSREGFDKLLEEVKYLKTRGRADMAKQIAEARDKGDLSENAEYDAAKDAQGLLELKISKMEVLVSNARLIDTSKIDTSKVSVMTTVTIKNVANNKEMRYTLVAEEEADLKKGKISVDSPIALGITGKKVGEIAEVKVPAGVVKFEILDISL